ncbi:hypothetical protein P2G88_12080 [Aliiglaciecola sp. CAU 1673]|uniref:hypothetical protein n=1 Tax=Aliiglaciecola sp. CAU 1673 TaxID=3032595 RepID=UPI0023DA53F4|nr:hypothetical protein [Aliiglaciecola sp. CAU 1673]MDF2178989.1 hypothetical protein [Aliiglaciecola sp. CAU 1673]
MDPTASLDDKNRSSYELNKREMFDGMRAYHHSEHQHKRDALNFLRSVLTVSAGVYGVIIGSFFTPEFNIQYAQWLAWGMLLMVALVTYSTVSNANDKIEADHQVYANFGEEYTRFCLILGLHQKVKVGETEIAAKHISPSAPIGRGQGYKKTQNIITSQGIGVVLIALVLSLLITLIET